MVSLHPDPLLLLHHFLGLYSHGKHGAHKVAELIRAFPGDQVLDNTDGTHQRIKIDAAQARKSLSAVGDKLPPMWDTVKQLGDDAINSLVFLAIVFSHHRLIDAMIASGTENMTGVVVRGSKLDGKAYTNFAHVFDQLALAEFHTQNEFRYDLSRLFAVDGLPPLAGDLLSLKLHAAG